MASIDVSYLTCDCIVDYFEHRKWVKNRVTFSNSHIARGYRFLKKSLEKFAKLKYRKEFSLYLFLFGYYAGRISNIDICYLTHRCIKENEITFERIKCNK